MDGRTLQAGTVTLGAEGAREFMKYDLALRQLIAKQLVEQTGTAGVMFELTHFGWQMAESFR